MRLHGNTTGPTWEERACMESHNVMGVTPSWGVRFRGDLMRYNSPNNANNNNLGHCELG
jgi:hypothetical protein